MSATYASLPVHLPSAETDAQNSDPFLFRRARTWWLLLNLFLAAQENSMFTRQDSAYWSVKDLSQKFDSKPNLMWLTAISCALGLCLMIGYIGPTLRTMLKQKTIAAFAVLAFLSTFWSQAPGMTFRRAVLLSLGLTVSCFFATYYSPQDLRRLMLAAGVVVGIACIAWAVLLPQYGISVDGEWKGIFGHKNHMGLGILFFFSGLPFCPIPNRRRLLVLMLQSLFPISLILLSRSMTSLILVFVLIAVRILGPFVASRRREQIPFVVYFIVVGIPVLALAITAGEGVILPLLGKDPSLSGRTDHWTILLPYMADHLWLGYGYKAFWTGSGDSLSVIRSVGGAMKGADSGYIDTMLQFGLVGIGWLMVFLLVFFRDFARLVRRSPMPTIAFWYVGVGIMMFVGSYTEGLITFGIPVPEIVGAIAFVGLRNLYDERAIPSPANRDSFRRLLPQVTQQVVES
jgi:exopolysaccharide production protein ExoQ